MRSLALGLCTIMSLTASNELRAQQPPASKVVLVIHGGAGVRSEKTMTPEMRAKYEAALRAALQAGYDSLKKGGTSLDAVETSIKVLEDSPLFNAGKGAVFTHEGRIELDASIMEGKGKNAGAVASVSRIKNPISAARAVMEKSPHVMMVGEGAERFAIGTGVPEGNPADLWTEERWKQLQEELELEKKDVGTKQAGGFVRSGSCFGTVGAVALDKQGNLAAGTSTGGMVNKKHGRVGDSPIIGAGTYAENGVGAVSGTGHGEIFIRFGVAHDIIARAKYGKAKTLVESAKQVLAGLPEEEGGVGGVIGLSPDGVPMMEFNSEGMYRGTVDENGEIRVMIYREQAPIK